ncbi:protein PROCA1 [Ahaetulla prasina]|uniref:protein PROCA1 n=1 Tax=Ahaetulla prasina TaxID=499056 RepID=UPI0026481189|nr:protein PROCA1 [Ahaetulla prasina]
MGLGMAAAAAAAAMLLAVAGAGLPPCSLDSRGSDGRLCAETGPEASALRGGGALERTRDAGSAGGRRRAKRGFTYPGTLWCGAGDIAENYEQLGEHQETDKCCREHDHCQHLIYPFTYKYGHRNLRWHTISHCDCDRRLKDCLSAVNNTASRVVGQAFFNIIQVPCFELVYQESCVESYLYVWCKNYSRMAVAVLKDPVMFDHGGERIDAPATRRLQPTSSTTTTSTTLSRKTHFRPLGNSPPPAWKPSQAAERWPTQAGPSPLPPKLRKGKGKGGGRGRKGKGAKQQKKKGPWDKAGAPIAHQDPAGEGAPLKLLAGQELGKGDAQDPHRHPQMGQGDSFNAILSDEPGRGGSEPDAAGLPESTQTVPQKGLPTTGPSGVRRRRRRKRKRRRKLQKEEESLPRHQKHSMAGRDLEEGRREGNVKAEQSPPTQRLG